MLLKLVYLLSSNLSSESDMAVVRLSLFDSRSDLIRTSPAEYDESLYTTTAEQVFVQSPQITMTVCIQPLRL